MYVDKKIVSKRHCLQILSYFFFQQQQYKKVLTEQFHTILDLFLMALPVSRYLVLRYPRYSGAKLRFPGLKKKNGTTSRTYSIRATFLLLGLVNITIAQTHNQVHPTINRIGTVKHNSIKVKILCIPFHRVKQTSCRAFSSGLSYISYNKEKL